MKVELWVNEKNEQIAYQLLASAISKKNKKKIRPYFELYTEDGDIMRVEDHDLQNDLWHDIASQEYD